MISGPKKSLEAAGAAADARKAARQAKNEADYISPEVKGFNTAIPLVIVEASKALTMASMELENYRLQLASSGIVHRFLFVLNRLLLAEEPSVIQSPSRVYKQTFWSFLKHGMQSRPETSASSLRSDAQDIGAVLDAERQGNAGNGTASEGYVRSLSTRFLKGLRRGLARDRVRVIRNPDAGIRLWRIPSVSG